MKNSSDPFSVRLAKEEFTFCAAHFITFAGNICEPLHGHNYRVEATVWGELDENQYVVDFIALRDTLIRLTRQFDHRVLLPTEHPMIKVTMEGAEVTARYEERRWVFPASDCVLLPVANTTAELLARHLGEQLMASLLPDGGFPFSRLELGVDECQGQWGIWRWEAE